MEESLKEMARRFRERIESFERRVEHLERRVREMDTRLSALQSAQAQLATDLLALIAQGAPIPAADIQMLVDNTNTLDVQVKAALIPPVAPVA